MGFFSDSVNELSKHFKPFQPENDTKITQFFFFNPKNQNELLEYNIVPKIITSLSNSPTPISIIAMFLFFKVLEKAVAQQLTACLEE